MILKPILNILKTNTRRYNTMVSKQRRRFYINWYKVCLCPSMKTIFQRSLMFLLVLVLFSFKPDKDYRKLSNHSFSRGEKLTFRLHYGFINAGEATFEVHPDLYLVNNRVCYKATVFGQSTGAFDMMMHIRDTWGTYIDTSAILTQRSYRDITENTYKLKEYVNFYPDQGLAKVERHHKGVKYEEHAIPMNIQDMVSGLYYLRTLDYKKMKKGDIIEVDAFFEDSLYDFQISYEGTENVKTKFGKINAVKLVPLMPENDLFKGKNPISVWISNDDNKVPLKVRANMIVGGVEIDLEKYEGLKTSSCFR